MQAVKQEHSEADYFLCLRNSGTLFCMPQTHNLYSRFTIAHFLSFELTELSYSLECL
jgi:hypothetical protein